MMTEVVSNSRASESSLSDVFEDYVVLTKKRPIKRKPKIKVSIVSTLPSTKNAEDQDFNVQTEDKAIATHDDGSSQYYDDSFLQFYEESHEDQLETVKEFKKRENEAQIRRQIAACDENERLERHRIEKVLQEQETEKRAVAGRSLEKYRIKIKQDEKRDRQRLNTQYRNKTDSNAQAINTRIATMHRNHNSELQHALQKYKQQAQQQQIPEQMASAGWQNEMQKLKARHQAKVQELTKKGEEYNRKTNSDYQIEQEKIRRNYEAKMKDAENSRVKLEAKLNSHFQQLRQRYLKRHIHKVVKERKHLESLVQPLDQIEKMDAVATNDDEKNAAEKKVELFPPAALKSVLPWVKDLSQRTGAALRYKHRKGVMSQIKKQMLVEIHNEGVWTTVQSSSSEDKRADSQSPAPEESSFIPWGLEARKLLHHITCGEVPSKFASSRSLDYMAQLHGSQVRCIVSDMRTSEDNATRMRISALRSVEAAGIQDLQKKYAGLIALQSDSEQALQKLEQEEKECKMAYEAAVKECAKAKREQEAFRSKFRTYIGHDGAPLQNLPQKNRQNLIKALDQYKGMVDAAIQKEGSLKTKASEFSLKLQKIHSQFKTSQRNSALVANAIKRRKASIGSRLSAVRLTQTNEQEIASMRVKELIDALKYVSRKRREETQQKHGNPKSGSWIKSFEGLSTPLKQSLWHKMHRRKQAIILRPTEEVLVNELRREVTKKIVAGSPGLAKPMEIESQLLRAERMFLLALHPEDSKGYLTSPSSKGTGEWAEPGYHINLSPPLEAKSDHDGMLRRQSFHVLNNNLAEMTSAPGRQASSLFRLSHLRCLESPLSSFSVASSLAESQALRDGTVIDYVEDPLFVSEQDMELGYTFNAKPSSTKPPSQPRKKPSGQKEQFTPVSGLDRGSSKGTSDAQTLVSPSNTETPKKRRAPKSSAGTTSPMSQKRKLQTEPYPGQRTTPPVHASAQDMSQQSIAMSPMAGGHYGRPYMHQAQQQMHGLAQSSKQRQSNQQQQQFPQQLAQMRMMQQHQHGTPPGFRGQMQPFFNPTGIGHPANSMPMQLPARSPIHPPAMTPQGKPVDRTQPQASMKSQDSNKNDKGRNDQQFIPK